MSGVTWYPDGDMIAIAALVIALLCFVTAAFFDRRDDHTAQLENGFFEMRPLRSAKVLMLGMALLTGCIIYGATRAGHCPTMTPFQNETNRIIAWILSGLCFIGTLIYAQNFFLKKIRFNGEELHVDTLFKGKKIYKWADMQDIRLKYGSRVLYFKNAERVNFPMGRSGSLQMVTMLNAKMFSFDKPPLLPVYDEKIAAHLKNETVLVVVFSVNSDFKIVPVDKFVGTFEKVDAIETIVNGPSGQMSGPSNIRNIYPFDELEEGELLSGPPPAWEMTWYVGDDFKRISDNAVIQ